MVKSSATDLCRQAFKQVNDLLAKRFIIIVIQLRGVLAIRADVCEELLLFR